jgi:hypothetical protein
MSEEKMLTKEIVEQFLADEDSVDLSEFTAVQPEAAERLSKREYLDLDGLTSLSDAAAESLSKHGTLLEDPYRGLYLNGLTSLSDAAAESLSKHEAPSSPLGAAVARLLAERDSAASGRKAALRLGI